MIAVDHDAQGRGVGTTLTEVATDWLRQSGMRVAMIETGGDPGHAPARRVYEKAGYTALPAVRFFKALWPSGFRDASECSARRGPAPVSARAPRPRARDTRWARKQTRAPVRAAAPRPID